MNTKDTVLLLITLLFATVLMAAGLYWPFVVIAGSALAMRGFSRWLNKPLFVSH